MSVNKSGSNQNQSPLVHLMTVERTTKHQKATEDKLVGKSTSDGDSKVSKSDFLKAKDLTDVLKRGDVSRRNRKKYRDQESKSTQEIDTLEKQGNQTQKSRNIGK